MVSSWDLDPKRRPSFHDIGDFFERQFSEVANSEKDKPADNTTSRSENRYSIPEHAQNAFLQLEEVEVYIPNPPKDIVCNATQPTEKSETENQRFVITTCV
jgi:hypothetical protein